MLKAEKIKKQYGNLAVLKGIDLSIETSEIVAITGASGAGKSTLLHILGTLDRPDSGAVFFKEQQISHLSASSLAQFRNQNIGFVFQFHNLLPEFSAIENVCLPAFIAGLGKKEAEKKAEKWLEKLGMAARAHHKPSELSGGEQQRVAVARALINSPAIIFADEPSGNLDEKNADQLHHLFFELRAEIGQTFVIVTHNTELANMADRRIVLEKGEVMRIN
ncbi:ABC transporter ATP-binding protein [Hugenholtzia roseola]|uniref:ABC transporter ATP-binding protein n=1 Tax=Hugenholtzia roseola TaxID=1002 RepID=UPI001B7FC056|nr:ABC transporter ATP-binding protein [Hugenholtzia roseola]